jgi:hypothetical protein
MHAHNLSSVEVASKTCNYLRVLACLVERDWLGELGWVQMELALDGAREPRLDQRAEHVGPRAQRRPQQHGHRRHSGRGRRRRRLLLLPLLPPSAAGGRRRRCRQRWPPAVERHLVAGDADADGAAAAPGLVELVELHQRYSKIQLFFCSVCKKFIFSPL